MTGYPRLGVKKQRIARKRIVSKAYTLRLTYPDPREFIEVIIDPMLFDEEVAVIAARAIVAEHMDRMEQRIEIRRNIE
jgi:hypothetical protein